MTILKERGNSVHDETMLLFPSMLFATLPLFAVLALSAALGRGNLQRRWMFVSLVLLGALGGLLFGLFGVDGVRAMMSVLHPGWGGTAYASYVEPFAEELGKALILLVVLRTRSYRSPIDGLLFGLAAGTGFAVVENIAYGTHAYGMGGMSAFWETMIPRVPASLIIHGGATALIGAGLAEVRWERRAWVLLSAFPALLLAATFIHGSWNHLIVEATRTQSVPDALGALALLACTSFLGYALLAYGILVERRAVAAELADEVRRGRIPADAVDQVTAKRDAKPFAWIKRDRKRTRVRRAALALAFALRGARAGQDTGREIAKLRRLFLAAVA